MSPLRLPTAKGLVTLASRIMTVAGACYGTLQVLGQHESDNPLRLLLSALLTAGLYGLAGAGLVNLIVLCIRAWHVFRS